MGRRGRRRASTDDGRSRAPAVRDRQARVKVTDDVWQDFRRLAYAEGVGEALGRLVTREVERWRVAQLRKGSADDNEVLDALERAHELQAALATIVDYLERRRCSNQPSPPGADW
jgi:hypothetical protein